MHDIFTNVSLPFLFTTIQIVPNVQQFLHEMIQERKSVTAKVSGHESYCMRYTGIMEAYSNLILFSY